MIIFSVQTGDTIKLLECHGQGFSQGDEYVVYLVHRNMTIEIKNKSGEVGKIPYGAYERKSNICISALRCFARTCKDVLSRL